MLTIAIAAAVLLLLIVVYFIITNSANEANGDTETTDTEALMDIGTFTILDEDYSDITEISYTYQGETFKFELSGDKWVLKDDPDYPIDQEIVFYMAQSISDYGGFRRLEYTDSCIEKYGFDEPLYDISVTYTDSDGSHTNRVRIGDQNSLTGYYYFYQDGSNYVYMVNNSIFSYFSYLKTDLFVTYELPTPEVKDITAMSVTAGGETLELDIPEVAATEDEDGNINYSEVELIMNTVCRGLHFGYQYYVDYNVTDEKNIEYGLDDPALTVAVDYVKYQSVSTEDGTSNAQISYDASFSVYFGNMFTVTSTDSDGNETISEKIYFTTDFSDIVYFADYTTYLEVLVHTGLE